MSENTRLDPVVILSPGRSGSTLLQRYLNLSDDLVVWGEHGGFISGLGTMYDRFMNYATAQRNIQSGLKNVDALLRSSPIVKRRIEWTNNFTSEDFTDGIRSFLLGLFAKDISNDQRWGFKEIRYLSDDLVFFRTLFPGVQYIFIVRNPLDTITSMVGAWEKGKWSDFSRDKQREVVIKYANKIAIRTSSYIKFISGNENHIITTYEDLSGNSREVVDTIFSFLRLESPAKRKIRLIAKSYLSVKRKNEIKEDILAYHQELIEYQEVNRLHHILESNALKV